ncbi:MAG: DUF58 domain-containing protein [Actinomycetota bacterium]
MPSPRGYLTAAVGIGLWAAGRVFGAEPLEQIGFALLALVVIGVVIVNSRRHDLTITRSVVPDRAKAGQAVDVELRLNNTGRGAAPLMLLNDRLPLELAGRARFALNGIEARGSREARYQIRPPRRGRYPIGPLGISFTDPFGLASTRAVGTNADELLVHPRIEKLALPRDRGQQRSLSTAALRQLSGTRGEDFYTLREYAEGDDLRKIHWPSTAKRDRPMIRQEETPWHTRALILLDDRRGAHDGVAESSSFERAVEAAASVADLYHRSGYTYGLLTADNRGQPSGRGIDHYHRCLDTLAVVQPALAPGDHDPLLMRLTELQTNVADQGTLVVALGSPSAEVATAITRCMRRFRQVIVVAFPAHRFGAQPTKQRWEGEQLVHDAALMLRRAGVQTLILGPGESLAIAWGGLHSGGRGGHAWAQKHAPA